VCSKERTGDEILNKGFWVALVVNGTKGTEEHMFSENIASFNARTGLPGRIVASATSREELRTMTGRAAAAVQWLTAQGRGGRADLLNAFADGLESSREQIVAQADAETALGIARLNGELDRTCFQLRFMADVALEGSYLGASIEHAGPTDIGPRPDIRKSAVPLGPVAVFGASNFPLAFSVPGGDTASALAAGCPVIVKAHSSHPGTSVLVADIFHRVLDIRQAPHGVFAVAFGRQAGQLLVTDPLITGVGFTGSTSGGRMLFDLAAARETPIPFYGELGSVNPLIVTEAAARERGSEIGAGIAASMTQGMGQFCTKPGLFLVPTSAAGQTVISALTTALRRTEPGFLLNAGIRSAFGTGVESMLDTPAKLLHQGEAEGLQVAPALFATTPASLTGAHGAALMEERFGPFGLVVTYETVEEITEVLSVLPPALTGTLHTAGNDPDLHEVTDALEKRSGRIVFNGYPTGVSVSWGMQHGGQYPASTAVAATSVGADSIRRWVRPVTYQDAPQEVLPPELQDTPVPGLLRRIDGALRVEEPAGVS
jgi:NADP-dependent aldehyde dehydrogenase